LLRADFGFKLDRFDFDQREYRSPSFGGAPGRRTVSPVRRSTCGSAMENVDGRPGGEVVVFRAPKSESIGETFEDAFGKDQAVLFGLRPQNLKDHSCLRIPLAPGMFNSWQSWRGRDVLFLQLGKANTHLIASFQRLFFGYVLAMIAKIDPGNPDVLEVGAPHWRSRKLPGWGKPDFLQPEGSAGAAANLKFLKPNTGLGRVQLAEGPDPKTTLA